MSHPVDRPDADGSDQPAEPRPVEPRISMDKPTSAQEPTAALPEERPRPSWGQPGPTESSTPASPAAPYGQPAQPSYGQPSYGHAGQPPYGQPGQQPYGQQASWPQQPGQSQAGQAGQNQPGQGQPGWQQPGWGPTPAQYGQDLGRQEERFAQFYGEKPRTGMSVTALVLGILTLLLSWAPLGSFLAIVLGILTIIFGTLGLRRGGRGMAIGGLVVGSIGLVIAVVASIFYVNLFIDYLDVATSCADQVGRPDGQAFERCVTDRSSEYNPFD